MKKYLSLITIIFILMVYSITGYKVFGEEFIIPIKYNDKGELLSNDIQYIHSFSLGNSIYTYYEAKVSQTYSYYQQLIYNGLKPYRDGTNFFIDISIGFDLYDLFDLRGYGMFVFYMGLPLNRYSFECNYTNSPTFRKQIKKLADYLDESGVVYSTMDYSKTFNSVLSNNIMIINYFQKIRTHLQKSSFMQEFLDMEKLYFNTKTKFKVGKKKFKYQLIRRNASTGRVVLSAGGLEAFQEFLDKKKINLKLSEYIKDETDDIETAIIDLDLNIDDHCNQNAYDKLINKLNSLEKWRKEGFGEHKYYILDLKDFVIGEVKTPYWLY